jgi:predicted nucleic acid-binding protein
MIYLDSSAAVKLVHSEPETRALRDWLDERADISWVSSALIEVESYRALARHAPDAVSRLPAVLDLVDVVDVTPQIRATACTLRPVSVRSLDAIHLATALLFGDRLTAFIAYDTRLANAAKAAGLPAEVPVSSPRQPGARPLG